MKLNLNPTAARMLLVLPITSVVCCVYCLILVPYLETPVLKPEKHDSGTFQKEQESPYSDFFAEGDWELSLDSVNLLKSNNIVMFFQNLTMDENKKIKSEKCTILVAPGENTFPMTRRFGKPFHPIKVSIHEGTEIQLSSEDDQLRARPLGGKLLGPVTISHKMQLQGHWVDCVVKTSDLICDMQSLQTSRPVRFMLGPFSAEGSQFKLLFEKSPNEQQLFSGVRSVQLGHLEHITLRITPLLLQQMNFKMTPEMQEHVRQMFGNQIEIPVTLKCDGPMIYEVATGILKFSQNVVLSCNYPNAPPDRLTCGELEIRLEPNLQERLLKDSKVQTTDSAQIATSQKNQAENSLIVSKTSGLATSSTPEIQDAASSEMEGIPVESIHAKQNVSLSVPTLQCTAEAENLSFFLRNQRLQLSGNEQATIRLQQNEFHAFELSYTFPPGNTQALGTFQSDQKGGWLKTSFAGSDAESAQELVLQWTGKLLGTPREQGRYDVQVAGQVMISSEQFGSLTADALSVRMRPRTSEDEQNDFKLAQALGEPLPEKSTDSTAKTKNDSQSNYLPEILRAQGNIHLNVEQESASLEGNLMNIEFKFHKPSELPPGFLQARKTERQRAPNGGGSMKPNFRQNNHSAQKSSNEEKIPRHFKLRAGDLKGQILLLPGDDGFFVREVTLNGPEQNPILLREESPLLTSEQAIALQARHIFLHDLHPQTLQCEISGPDAFLAGLGIRLECAQIALNCAANRIDVNGAGKMYVFTRQNAGVNLNYSTINETVVSWGKGFSFDGQKLAVKDQVQIKMGSTSLQADLIHADLTERIQLSSPPQISSSDESVVLDFFQNISAEHNVQVTHQNFTPTGKLSDVFLLNTHFVNFFPETMTVEVTGKGFLRLSHLGAIGNFTAQKKATNSEPAPDSAKSEEWFQILMKYNQGITGKLQEGEFSMKGRISALGYPVPNPEYRISQTQIDPRLIPEMGFQFCCEEIFVNQTPTIQKDSFQLENSNGKNLEMLAKGNVQMKNSTLSIEGSQMKYSQEKETCSIQGEPNIPVYIVQQEFRGGRRNETRTGCVDVNLKTMKIKSDNFTTDSTF